MTKSIEYPNSDPGRRVRRDATGVVAGARRDDPGTEDREDRERTYHATAAARAAADGTGTGRSSIGQLRTWLLSHQPRSRRKRTWPRSGTRASTRSSARMRPTGRSSSSITSTDEPRESMNRFDHLVERGVGGDGHRLGRPGHVDHRVVLRRDEQLEQPDVVHEPTGLVDDDHRVDVRLVLGLAAQDPAHLADGLLRAHEHEVRRHDTTGRPLAVEEQRAQRGPPRPPASARAARRPRRARGRAARRPPRPAPSRRAATRRAPCVDSRSSAPRWSGSISSSASAAVSWSSWASSSWRSSRPSSSSRSASSPGRSRRSAWFGVCSRMRTGRRRRRPRPGRRCRTAGSRPSR